MRITPSIRMIELPSDQVHRPTILDTITRTLESNHLQILEGDGGFGKTTLLTQFVLLNSANSISYFIDPSDRYTYNAEGFKLDMANQLSSFIFERDHAEQSVSDNYFTSIRTRLERKIREINKPFYVVLDGLDSIDYLEASVFQNFINELPYQKVRFILSGNQDKILRFFKGKKISFRSMTLIFFSLTETEQFFRDLNPTPAELQEIYKISKKGQPSRLEMIKRNCIVDGLKNFINNEITDATDLYQLEWNDKVTDEDIENVLGVIAFGDSKYSIQDLALILELEVNYVAIRVENVGFTEESNGVVTFIAESYRTYTIRRLENKKDKYYGFLIKYYTSHYSHDAGNLNLPTMYFKARKFTDLLSHLSLDRLVGYLEATNSLFFINKQFEIGINASRENENSEDEFLKFALYKSSLQSIENDAFDEGELEAYIKLDQIDKAKDLINAIYIKENRFRGMATLVKLLKENNKGGYEPLIELVTELYHEIDLELFKHNVIEISALLIYTKPDLAIDLIERYTDNSSTKDSLDHALSYLSLFVQNNARIKDRSIIDVQEINDKIKDDELKTMTRAIQYLGTEYTVSEMQSMLDKIPSVSKRLTILRNWLKFNAITTNAEVLVLYALNLVIQSSAETVPNATALFELCSPLPHIKDYSKLQEIIDQVDSQKSTINVPIRDYIKLQFQIAIALAQFDRVKCEERIFEVFIVIDDYSDLALKMDCLVQLYACLKKIPYGSEIEKTVSGQRLIDLIMGACMELLRTTAYQYKIFENVIKNLSVDEPDFVFKLAENINIEERRDLAFQLILSSYIRSNSKTVWDDAYLQKVLMCIGDVEKRDLTIFEFFAVLERKLKQDFKLDGLDKFFEWSDLIIMPGKRALSLSKLIILVHKYEVGSSELFGKWFLNLESAWNEIDSMWDKIEVGYRIVADLSECFPEHAEAFLSRVAAYRKDETLTSFDIACAYLYSIRLSIKAIEGLAQEEQELKNAIVLIGNSIGRVRSEAEQIKLWNELIIVLYRSKQFELAKELAGKHVVKLVTTNQLKPALRLNTFPLIGPSLFIYHKDLLSQEIEGLSEGFKDKVLE